MHKFFIPVKMVEKKIINIECHKIRPSLKIKLLRNK